MEPGRVYEITIEPQATSNYFAPGHRTPTPPSRSASSAASPWHQSVFHDAALPSHIVLPIIPEDC